MSEPPRPRGAALLLVAVLALLAMLFASPSAQAAGSLRFGAFTPGDPYNGQVDGSERLQAQIVRRVDIVLWYQNWGGGDWISSVQPHLIDAVGGSGRTPLITWEPWDPSAGVDQPGYSLAAIADGEFDAYIRTWAERLRDSGRTIYLRPMHEMNGNWYPWAGSVNGNSPALFVQAWRRMHGIFETVGASNVRWVWSPNNFDVPAAATNRMESYYPGSGYVDVLAVDGYNWGSTAPQNGGWQTFSQVFAGAYERLRRLGPQPIWIAEVGAAPEGGDKAAWVRDMFARAGRMDRLEAIVWFNENKERDWRAAPNAEVAAAFRPLAPRLEPTAPGRPRTVEPRLELRAARRIAVGRRMRVSWRTRGPVSVERWHVLLNGRRVSVIGSDRRPVLRRRIRRAGRQRWTVEGRDAGGRTIVAASRSFRAHRPR